MDVEQPGVRTFQVRSLERNSSYYLVFTCTDIYGEQWASDWIYFTTGQYCLGLLQEVNLRPIDKVFLI